MKIRRIACHLAAVLVLAWAGRAAALPDVAPQIFDVSLDENQTVDPGDVLEGCAGAQTGRRLLAFSLRVRSLGPDDLVLGDPGCPDCSTNPGAPCANPLYVCSEAHGHPHFESFVATELLDPNGDAAVIGRKQGFCLLDFECPAPRFDCGFQGISAGCADVYERGLPCQYVDLTDASLPDGDYTLRLALDPEDAIAEADEANNVITVPIHIGPPVPPPPPVCPVFAATDLPQPIPDEGRATSTLSVPRAGTIERVRVVDLRGTHTFTEDLLFRLTSAQGTAVTLLDRVCGASDDFDIDLADDGTLPIPCPMTDGGLHLPASPLAALAGEDAAGDWVLTVDDLEAGDQGQLDAWGLEICTACGNGVVDPGELCDDGNASDGDCCSSDCQTGCDPCLVCQPPLGCVPPPNVLCDSAPPPLTSAIVLRKNPADPARDALAWTWKSGAPVALLDFGAPASVTDLTLCVLDETGLRLSTTAEADGACGGRPCWTASGERITYVDRELTPDGLLRLMLRPGAAGEARIVAKGKGPNLGLPALGLTGEVTVRLKRSGGPACWQARFAAPRRNDAERYRARVAN